MANQLARAVSITRFGEPEVLAVTQVPLAEPAAGRVRVRVATSGLNRADLLQRLGRYPAPPGWPQEVPGLEYAGAVDAVGEGVRQLRVGDAVMGIVGGGGYAEVVVVDERDAVRVPEGMDPADAGAIPEVFMTAFDALFRQVRLSAGETVLIHAVGSGVGTAALQLARAAGAFTVGTSRTEEKLRRAGELGLDVAVRVEGAEWAARAREATRGRGVDVILDLVGGPYAAGNLEALSERGRWIVVGVTGGTAGAFDFRTLITRRASITGTSLRARPAEEKTALARQFEAHVVPLFERGLIRPIVDRTFAPEDAPEAHRVMEANLNFGKLLLRWT